MLIRILTINLHLPLYLQAASIDGCAARLSASEVPFFTFLSIFTSGSGFVLQILLTGGHLCPTCSFILDQEKGEWRRVRENNFTFSVLVFKGEWRRVRKQFYLLSFSFQSLSDQVGDLREARSSHGCAPYISPEVYRVVYQPRGFPLFLIPSPAQTRLTYNCAHLGSTKESLTDSVKKKFVRKFFCVKICWVKIFLGKNFLGENCFW